MSRIFVFGNSYTVRTILLTINCLLNFSVDEVIVLRENHISCDQMLLKDEITLCIQDTIDDCIVSCDQVLILNSEDISKQAIKQLIDLADMLKKRYYLINVPESRGECEQPRIPIVKESLPVIMNISFGECTQLFCIETLLNNIFYQSDIPILQNFSQNTYNILNQFMEKDILHKSLLRQMLSSEFSPEIAICSLNIGNSLYNMRNYIEYFNNIRPDFIIFHIDAMMNVSDNIHNIVRFCCLSEIDMVVKSHYSMVDDKYMVFCNFSINDDIYDVESRNIKNDIFSRIITKLTYPQNIKRLQF